jgi:hypothetical protein
MKPPNHDGDGGGNHKKQKESRNAIHDGGSAIYYPGVRLSKVVIESARALATLIIGAGALHFLSGIEQPFPGQIFLMLYRRNHLFNSVKELIMMDFDNDNLLLRFSTP